MVLKSIVERHSIMKVIYEPISHPPIPRTVRIVLKEHTLAF
jgi:hypothetical protein